MLLKDFKLMEIKSHCAFLFAGNLFQNLVSVYVSYACTHMCGCEYARTTALRWRSEVSLRCQFLPSALSEAVSWLFSDAYPRLSDTQAVGRSLVSFLPLHCRKNRNTTSLCNAWLSVGPGDLNSAPHTCVASAVPVEPSSQVLFL